MAVPLLLPQLCSQRWWSESISFGVKTSSPRSSSFSSSCPLLSLPSHRCVAPYSAGASVAIPSTGDCPSPQSPSHRNRYSGKTITFAWITCSLTFIESIHIQVCGLHPALVVDRPDGPPAQTDCLENDPVNEYAKEKRRERK